ncbi:MAG: hypothetical protein PHY59_02980 [Methanobacterium sp.]|nr:hypothetical protein [Methanobacterium sp.]
MTPTVGRKKQPKIVIDHCLIINPIIIKIIPGIKIQLGNKAILYPANKKATETIIKILTIINSADHLSLSYIIFPSFTEGNMIIHKILITYNK